jgi:hypothetical protein
VKLESDPGGSLAAKSYIRFMPDRLTLLFASDQQPHAARWQTLARERA